MINTKAPYFRAKAFHNDKIVEINLSDYEGKWLILFFYPQDFNIVCQNELEGLIDNYEDLKKNEVEILIISTDTEFTHRAWHESSELLKSIKFPMVADRSGRISKDYGTYIKEEGVSSKATFIMDPERRIRYYEINDNLLSRDINGIIKKVYALKFSRKNMQEFCPTNSESGKMEIKINSNIIKIKNWNEIK
jgi:peroxiredoxin (alkyl hydroperoxide reductase subunit C)